MIYNDNDIRIVMIHTSTITIRHHQHYHRRRHHHRHRHDHDKSTISIRQEPCIYVNGKPYNVRATDDMTNHLVLTEVLFSKH